MSEGAAKLKYGADDGNRTRVFKAECLQPSVMGEAFDNSKVDDSFYLA